MTVVNRKWLSISKRLIKIFPRGNNVDDSPPTSDDGGLRISVSDLAGIGWSPMGAECDTVTRQSDPKLKTATGSFKWAFS